MTDSSPTQSTHWDGCHKVHDHGPPEGEDMTDSADAPEEIYIQYDHDEGEVVVRWDKGILYRRADLAMERSEVEATVREALDHLLPGAGDSIDESDIEAVKDLLRTLLDEDEENDG